VFLLIACYRSEDVASSPTLRAMLDPACPAGRAIQLRKLVVEPLGREEACELALTLLGRRDEPAQRLGRRIAEESQGNPDLVDALVRHARTVRDPATPRVGVNLDEVLWARVGRLPEPVRRLLEVIAVAADPLRQSDALRAATFHAQGLSRALRCGEPLCAARFLAMEGILAAIPGEPAQRCVEEILTRAEAIAQGLQDPYTTGLLATAWGVTACLQGRWKRSVEECDRAEQLFREHCAGVIWERDPAQGFAPSALSWAGEVGELARRLPGLDRDAERRGSLFALARICTLILPSLAADEPDEAERRIAECMRRWSRESFHVQHYKGLYAQVQIDLYRGKGPNAWQRIEQQWPALVRSFLLCSQLARVFIHFARALGPGGRRRGIPEFAAAARRSA
jgi:hypothetical protein